MHIAVDLNASFAVHAGSCVWRLLSSSVAMRRMGKGVRSPRLLFCGCGAPRVTALSWAPCALCGGRGFLPFPVGCGNELGGDGGGCLLLMHGGWLLALCAFPAWMPSRGV
ncbi:surface protease GP63 [Trypanosoma cruzi]|nr:surface protease GP63 [Trypanosoma cruzi]